MCACVHRFRAGFVTLSYSGVFHPGYINMYIYIYSLCCSLQPQSATSSPSSHLSAVQNSGDIPESANWALSWFHTVPCKREGRRFQGLYVSSQNDIMADPQASPPQAPTMCVHPHDCDVRLGVISFKSSSCPGSHSQFRVTMTVYCQPKTRIRRI